MAYRPKLAAANAKMAPMLAEIVMNASSSKTLKSLKNKGFQPYGPVAQQDRAVAS